MPCGDESGSSLFGRQKSRVTQLSQNHARPAIKRSPPRHSVVRLKHSFAPAVHKAGCCRAQWRSRPALPRRPEGLVLTAVSTAACWMPLGPRKVFDAARRAFLLSGMGTQALPLWDEEDEAGPSGGRPYRCSHGRHKNRNDLTSSFVPRGTSSARWRKLVLAFQCLCKSGGAITPVQPRPSSSGTPCRQPRYGA